MWRSAAATGRPQARNAAARGATAYTRQGRRGGCIQGTTRGRPASSSPVLNAHQSQANTRCRQAQRAVHRAPPDPRARMHEPARFPTHPLAQSRRVVQRRTSGVAGVFLEMTWVPMPGWAHAQGCRPGKGQWAGSCRASHGEPAKFPCGLCRARCQQRPPTAAQANPDRRGGSPVVLASKPHGQGGDRRSGACCKPAPVLRSRQEHGRPGASLQQRLSRREHPRNWWLSWGRRIRSRWRICVCGGRHKCARGKGRWGHHNSGNSDQ